MTRQDMLKQEILEKTKEYYELVHKPIQERKFIDGETRVNYAGRVFDAKEMQYLVDSALDFWLTYGDYSKQFEKKIAEYI